MKRPFAVIGITVFAVLAVLGGAGDAAVLTGLVLFTSALLISVVVKSIRRQSVFPVAFASAAVACLILICTNELVYYPALKLADTQADARILITGEPEIRYGNCYYDATATEIDGEKAKVKIRLVFSSSPEISPYDTLSGTFRFYALGQYSDDLLVSYKSQNRFIGAYAVDGKYDDLGSSGFHPGRYAVSFRAAVRKTIMKLLPNDYGALCCALITGDRSALSQDSYDSLKDSSASHIICVSGLHVSLWVSAVLWLLKKLKLGTGLSALLTVPAVFAVMLMTGMSYSVIRAGIMMTVYLISALFMKKSDSLNSLGISLAVISAANPFAPCSVSLQLSALATAGIILCGEYVLPSVDEFFNKKHIIRYAAKPVKLLLITASAAAFTLPVTLPMYEGFNFGVFLSNPLIVPAAEACMICSAVGAATGIVLPGVINIPAFAGGLLAKFILKISYFTSSASFLRAGIGYADACAVMCAVFMLCALAVFIAYTGKKVFPAAAFITAGVFVCSVCFFAVSDSAGTRLTVFDTGNGSSAYISCGDSGILLGCGGDLLSGEYQIKKILKKQKNKTKAVILPNPDASFTAFLPGMIAYTGGAGLYSGSSLPPFYGREISPLPDDFRAGPISVKLCRDNSEKTAYLIETNDITLLYICDPAVDFYSLSPSPVNADVMLCRADYPQKCEFSGIKLVAVQADNASGCAVQNELKAAGVNAAATAENGNIIITADAHKIKAERG